MKTTSVRTNQGPRKVPVLAESGGLGVTPSLDAPARYAITHLPTGFAITGGPPSFEDLEEAVAAMERLAKIHDWTPTTPETLKLSPGLYEKTLAAMRPAKAVQP